MHVCNHCGKGVNASSRVAHLRLVHKIKGLPGKPIQPSEHYTWKFPAGSAPVRAHRAVKRLMGQLDGLTSDELTALSGMLAKDGHNMSVHLRKLSIPRSKERPEDRTRDYQLSWTAVEKVHTAP